MNIKSLLIASAIVLPLSACGHMQHKGPEGKKKCEVSRHLVKAEKGLTEATKNLQAAADAAPDANVKKKLHKLAKDSAALADKASDCKKMCDAKHDKPEGKKAAAKKAHQAKPVAPAAAPAAAAPADAKKAN